MKKTTLLLATASILAIPAATPAADPPGAAHGQDRHHQGIAGAVGAFHDLMEPLWHSAPGKALVASACGQSADILGRAKAVAAEPGGDPYRAAAGKLQGSAEALRGACDRNDGPAVETELGRLHAYFHGLAATLGR